MRRISAVLLLCATFLPLAGCTRSVYNNYRELERLFWPDLFIVGGGISKRSAEFLADIDVDTPMRAAKLLNNAGIVGAGLMGFNKRKMKVRRARS